MKIGTNIKPYKVCNLRVRFSKYEFYIKLFDGVILFRVTPSVI